MHPACPTAPPTIAVRRWSFLFFVCAQSVSRLRRQGCGTYGTSPARFGGTRATRTRARSAAVELRSPLSHIHTHTLTHSSGGTATQGCSSRRRSEFHPGQLRAARPAGGRRVGGWLCLVSPCCSPSSRCASQFLRSPVRSLSPPCWPLVKSIGPGRLANVTCRAIINTLRG